jgi:hypothetical protein
MSRPRYIPDPDAAFLVWFENFVAKFAGVAATLGLASDLTTAQADLAFVRFVINNTEAQRNRLSDNVSVKNQLLNGPIGTAAVTYPGPAALTGLIPPMPGAPSGTPSTPPAAVPTGVIARIDAMVKRIVAAVNYVPGMGQDMDIIAPSQGAPNLNDLKPEIAASTQGMKVLIEWTKARGTDGLRIEADYGTGSFVHVIDDTRPDHLDEHPLPPAGQAAVWKYRAFYVKDGKPVGQCSDMVTVAVTGM